MRATFQDMLLLLIVAVVFLGLHSGSYTFRVFHRLFSDASGLNEWYDSIFYSFYIKLLQVIGESLIIITS